MDYKILKTQDALSYRGIRLESLKLHPECFGSTYEDERNKLELFFENQIRVQSSKNIMIGVYSNLDLVGLCGLITTEYNQFLIVQMYVKNSYRGQGVSQGLLVKAKLLLKQYKRSGLLLTVYEGNESALRSYQRAGFVQIARQDKEITMCFQL